MFLPNITIADTNYLNRGVLLYVNPLGFKAIKHAMTCQMMNSKWYKNRPDAAFMQGEFNIPGDPDRMYVFIECMSMVMGKNREFMEYIQKVMDSANNSEEELYKRAKIALDLSETKW